LPTIITVPVAQPAQRTSVKGVGRMVKHECTDSDGKTHRQRLALGSVRGVFYLDSICTHCSAHLIWVEEDSPDLAEYERARSKS